MAAGVFGISISEQTVRASGEYTEPITQKDVANYAMRMINAGGKDNDAQKFVDNLQDRYGDGRSAKCLIYNATGTDLNLVSYKDWSGHIYDTPYPSVIQNGQWGAFLHVRRRSPFGSSVGAVVYRSKKASSSGFYDWLFSWSVPWFDDTSVYTEIGVEWNVTKNYWNRISRELEKSSRSSIGSVGNEYVSQTDIGEGTAVDARAVFQFPY